MNRKFYEKITTEHMIIEPSSIDSEGKSYWIDFYVDLKTETHDAMSVCGATVFVNYDEDYLRFEWEPDREPTYVPYGNTYVLYDSGEGGLESVDTSDALEIEEVQIRSIDDLDQAYDWGSTPMGQDDIILMLEDIGVSMQEFEEVLNSMKKRALEMVNEQIEEFYEDPCNWPSKPKDEGPDYDPYE